MMGLATFFGAPTVSPEPAPPSLSPLLQAAARGDERAIRGLYLEHEVAVRRFAARLVGDADGAEDLVQEVFVALPDALARFRGASSVRTFLLSMTAHRASHYVRAAARRRAAHARLETEAQGQPPQPDATLRRKELAAALQRALDDIPLDQRVAFVLCEVEERSSPEAAEIVGESEATVRARVMLAKKKLRELLEKRGAR